MSNQVNEQDKVAIDVLNADVTRDASLIGLNGTKGNIMSYDQGADGSGGTSDTGDSTDTKTNSTNMYKSATPSEYKPGPTATGASAALDTVYSWDKKGVEKADTTYQQEVLTQKQNLLANRETLEANAQAAQAQADMMKYTQQQAAEKVGWAGGYVLDQNRQMEYLKASIQSQMYGAMELQKYGYDSALAAARLSYDLNQQQFAQQYYNDAVTQALSEAQLTGTYFSAETKDMMAQQAVAEQILKNSADKLNSDKKSFIDGYTPTDEEKKALQIKNNIEKWFEANGVTEAGVKTLAAWQAEENNKLAWEQQNWIKYEASLKAAEESLQSGQVIQMDPSGNVITKEDGTPATFDFTKTTVEDWMKYGEKGDSKEQVLGYIDDLVNKAITTYGSTVQKAGENDSIYYEIDSTKLKDAIVKDLIAKGILKETTTDGQTTLGYASTEIGEYFKDYSLDTVLGTNVNISLTIDNLIKGEINITNSGKKDDKVIVDETKVTGLENIVTDPNSFASFKDHVSFQVKDQADVNGTNADDDINIDMYWDGNKKKSYNIDVDWSSNVEYDAFTYNTYRDETKLTPEKATIAFSNTLTFLKNMYGTPSSDTFAIYEYQTDNGFVEQLWYYNSANKQWGYVQNNVGGKNLLADLKQAKTGTTPTRWK